MKKLVWFVWWSFLILSTSYRVEACSCWVLDTLGKSVKQQVEDARSRASAVFVGEVVKIDELSSPRSKSVTLVVRSIWKGIRASTVTIVTGRGGGDCGYPFDLGTSYLVYAYQSIDTFLRTGICQRTTAYRTDLVDLKYLGEPGIQIPIGGLAPEEYWFNQPSSPVRIVVKRGSRPDRPDEFFENVSNGSVTALQLGCVTKEQTTIKIVKQGAEEEVDLSPASSDRSKMLLPKGDHGNYLWICKGSGKVTIVAVKFADGGRWSIQ